MSSIRFICQCCSQPLKPYQSTEILGLSTTQRFAVSMLTSAQGQPAGEGVGRTSREETDIEKQQDGASCRPDEGLTSRESSNNFTLLGEFVPMGSLSSIQKVAGDIFDILTGTKEVDHPLCEECTSTLLEQLDTQLTITEHDNQNYRGSLETGKLMSEFAKDMLQMELTGLELEEARLVKELEELEKNGKRATEDLRAAQVETEALDQQEKQNQRVYSELKQQELDLLDELTSVDNRLRYAQTQLEWLQKTNVFSITFDIWQEGPLGVINNFRLGCLPTVPVSWNEINAAWGQTALLLLALSNKIGLEFQRYRLVPCGNHSYLRSLTDDSIELPLFCYGGQSVFLDNKFDYAMMAFLDCMQQFKEEAEKGESGLCLPYRINVKNGLMEDPASGSEYYSIRTLLNTEEQWTKALKFMLVNLKWSLAWVSLRYCQK
ncbi:beclin-2 [Choloepus didactylus]|uniref:beclin-2 n=1 Tax=Choloepus didactylus TaxID=27675 RepID=UPI00189CAA3D|nr:beclin-2 [Choloepus didactylus]